MGEWTQPPLGFPLCAIVSEAITTSSLSSSPILSGATQLTVPAVIRPKGCDTHATDCTINRLCMLIGLCCATQCWTMFVTCAIIIPLGSSWPYILVSRNHIRCCSSAAKIKSSAIFQWIWAAAATYRESSVHLRRSDPRILLLFSGAPWNYAPMFCLFVIGDTQQNTNAHRHIHGATTRRESEAPSERELDFREHELDTRERLRKKSLDMKPFTSFIRAPPSDANQVIVQRIKRFYWSYFFIGIFSKIRCLLFGTLCEWER